MLFGVSVVSLNRISSIGTQGHLLPHGPALHPLNVDPHSLAPLLTLRPHHLSQRPCKLIQPAVAPPGYPHNHALTTRLCITQRLWMPRVHSQSPKDGAKPPTLNLPFRHNNSKRPQPYWPPSGAINPAGRDDIAQRPQYRRAAKPDLDSTEHPSRLFINKGGTAHKTTH